ncbi:MAG: hypothetical protein WAT29_19515 [Thiolinea sp.]
MDYKNIIKSDLARSENSSCVIEIAFAILDFFTSHDPKHHDQLSASSFSKKIPLAKSYPHELVRALSYFSMGKVHLFEMEFKYFDEQEGRFFKIDSNEIAKAYKSHYLIHPVTGAEIDDFKEKISISYKPTDVAYSIYKSS